MERVYGAKWAMGNVGMGTPNENNVRKDAVFMVRMEGLEPSSL